MPEHDLTDRLTEQLGPIIETMQRRIQTELPDRDKAAIAHALVDATITGARVMWASVAANAAESGHRAAGVDDSERAAQPELLAVR